MATQDPRIDAYIAKSPDFAKPILSYIREVVHEGCPEVEETLKWNAPAFMYKGILCGMAAFKAHCVFGFWRGTLLAQRGEGPEVDKSAMGGYGRVHSLSDLPGRKAFVGLVRKAVRLHDQDVKVKRPLKHPKPRLRTPADLMAALKRNRKALATYQSFSPTHKRDYVEWLIEAKTDATRQRRLQTAVAWMAAGKIRNWKYAQK